MKKYQVNFRNKKTGELICKTVIFSNDTTGICLKGKLQMVKEGFKFDKKKHTVGLMEI